MAKREKVKRNTAAGRLYHILEAAGERSEGEIIMHVLCDIFGIKPPSMSTLFPYLTELDRLFIQVKKDLEEEDRNKQTDYLSSFSTLQAITGTTHFGEKWGTYKPRLQPNTEAMVSLRLAAQNLSNQRPEPQVSEEELSRIQAEINSLLEEVLQPDVLDTHPELKRFIAEHLELIFRAIIHYRLGLTNIATLQKTFTDTVGANAFRNGRMFQESDDTESEKEKARLLGRFYQSVWEFGRAAFSSNAQALLGATALYVLFSVPSPNEFVKEYAPSIASYSAGVIEALTPERKQIEYKPEGEKDEHQDTSKNEEVAVVTQVVSKKEEEGETEDDPDS